VRIELRVPSTEQEQARRRGARWDGEQKSWYIPDGIEHTGFEQWLPTSQAPKRRAPEWFLAGRKSIAAILKELT
jgi:Domain of unknown function (DUF5710)